MSFSSVLDEIKNLAKIDEQSEADSMETEAPIGVSSVPHFNKKKPQTDNDELSLLILYMHQLTSCISLAPILAVHIAYTHIVARLEQVAPLVHISHNVTTEEVVRVLLLHQGIVGLISACPHTFVRRELEDYVSKTQALIDSLYGRFKAQIADDSSEKAGDILSIPFPS